MRTKLEPGKINIQGKIGDLLSFFDKIPFIFAVFLYGSYGTEYQTPLSDVDIAIFIDPDKEILFQEELQLGADLTSISGEDDINLLIINHAPVVLQYNIISTGSMIYERSTDRVSDFIEKVIKNYADYAIDMQFFYRDYDNSLKEAYRT